MRKMVLLLTATVFMLSSVPAFSQMTQAQKDECLLASKNCITAVDDIQTRIKKLNKEIKKGTRVYDPQELKKLEAKLNETRQMLKQIEENRGGE